MNRNQSFQTSRYTFPHQQQPQTIINNLMLQQQQQQFRTSNQFNSERILGHQSVQNGLRNPLPFNSQKHVRPWHQNPQQSQFNQFTNPVHSNNPFIRAASNNAECFPTMLSSPTPTNFNSNGVLTQTFPSHSVLGNNPCHFIPTHQPPPSMNVQTSVPFGSCNKFSSGQSNPDFQAPMQHYTAHKHNFASKLNSGYEKVRTNNSRMTFPSQKYDNNKVPADLSPRYNSGSKHESSHRIGTYQLSHGQKKHDEVAVELEDNLNNSVKNKVSKSGYTTLGFNSSSKNDDRKSQYREKRDEISRSRDEKKHISVRKHIDHADSSKYNPRKESYRETEKLNLKDGRRNSYTYRNDRNQDREKNTFSSRNERKTVSSRSKSSRFSRSPIRERKLRTHSSSSSSQSCKVSKRSRSPSLTYEQDLGTIHKHLSQYRQDLLCSEQLDNNDMDKLSPSKKRKIESDLAENLESEPVGYFTRSCPADLYFFKNPETGNMEATSRMVELENRFEEDIVKRSEKRTPNIEELLPPCSTHHHHHHCSGHKSSSCDSSSSEDDDDDDDDEGAVSQIMEEWDRRKKFPNSLHPELWFNIKGQANDGPLCRCSIKSRQSGIRHDIYPGEMPLELCDEESNNIHRLYHYRLTMSPYTNFLTKVPTLINHDNHEYIFEGFSMFSHVKLENIPACKLLRFNIEYTIHFIPEAAPENFTIRSLNLFNRFIFTEILDLFDMDWTGQKGGCNRFHFMPRFCRTLPDSGCKEVLSMNTVLNFLLKSAIPLVDESRVNEIMESGESEWHTMVDNLRGMIVTNPGMKPSSIRIDQLDRKVLTLQGNPLKQNLDNDSEKEKKNTEKHNESQILEEDGSLKYPLIIHQGYRPAQLSYAGDPVYRKAWKQYVKFRHLLNSKPKILAADKMKLKEQEEKLREIRMKKTMKREVTIELSSKGFLCTGLRSDLCQHALMIPVLMSHLRFHICLDVLENSIDYKFVDRNLLQLSLTHTSYRTNYGTNPDHTRNSLTNCGMRQVEYGDRRIHYQNTRKRGICILVDIMSRLGKQEETVSEIPHNERLEFLGDAVIEFLTSVHLFYMFPWLEEGGLTTYRMALVQNQHLAVLAKKLKLQDFMLYVHGPDLCHESDLQHAMANCCEAIMGALFLDGGIDVVDRIFSKALFDDDEILLHTWNDLPKHVLQQQEPGGDRRWVKSSPILQKLEKFEESIGIRFNHIRLLAKAFTHRNIGVNPLTMGHNQRLEFLGDTVLQLVASEYLYKHYPEHHEGHLSLLRSSLVNSRTQGLVYDDLGMSEYVIYNENAISDGVDMKTKQRADILESFVGALFVDKDLDYCTAFCNVCFFPRLKDFIMNQDWNDPKSQLQQCCLTLREVGGGEPDIPVYKVIESIGPTNTRKYVVAVYFRGKRLARGTGHSIQQAEMAAATQALKKRAELFPILQHQRRFLERMKKGERPSDDEMANDRRKMNKYKQKQRDKK
nr:ribonuclease 3-like [Biomphalaria glabrata]